MKIVEQTQSRMIVQRSPLTQMAAGGVLLVAGVFLLSQARNTSTAGLVLTLAFVGAGLLILISARRITVSVDKLGATVSISSKSLVGRVQNRSIAIADIDRLTYDEVYFTERVNGRYHANRRSSSILVLKDGSAVVLAREQSEGAGVLDILSFSRADMTVDRALSEYIGVPFFERGG
jgi:UPF0716 family protein affecting phage T7 exclusion